MRDFRVQGVGCRVQGVRQIYSTSKADKTPREGEMLILAIAAVARLQPFRLKSPPRGAGWRAKGSRRGRGTVRVWRCGHGFRSSYHSARKRGGMREETAAERAREREIQIMYAVARGRMHLQRCAHVLGRRPRTCQARRLVRQDRHGGPPAWKRLRPVLPSAHLRALLNCSVHTHACMHACNLYTQACMHACMHTRTHTHARICAHAQMCTLTRTRTPRSGIA